jgi:hypothetical protein
MKLTRKQNEGLWLVKNKMPTRADDTGDEDRQKLNEKLKINMIGHNFDIHITHFVAPDHSKFDQQLLLSLKQDVSSLKAKE